MAKKIIKPLNQVQIIQFHRIGLLYLGLDKNQNHKFSGIKMMKHGTFIKFYHKTQEGKCYRNIGEGGDADYGRGFYEVKVKGIKLRNPFLSKIKEVMEKPLSDYISDDKYEDTRVRTLNGFKYMRLEEHHNPPTYEDQGDKDGGTQYYYVPDNKFKLTERMLRKAKNQNERKEK